MNHIVDGIPSPNPEYPQQIKNVTGNANVKIQNKNLFTADYSQFNSTGGEGTLYDYFKLPENDKVYTISVIAKNDFTPTSSTYLGFTGNGGNAGSGNRWVIAGTSTSTITKGTKISINNLDNEKNLRYVSMYSKGATNLKKCVIQEKNGSDEPIGLKCFISATFYNIFFAQYIEKNVIKRYLLRNQSKRSSR